MLKRYLEAVDLIRTHAVLRMSRLWGLSGNIPVLHAEEAFLECGRRPGYAAPIDFVCNQAEHLK